MAIDNIPTEARPAHYNHGDFYVHGGYKHLSQPVKVGILTFHRCINYGSYWQAKCLADGLQQKGYHAEILDHYDPDINYKELKCALQPVLPAPVPPSDWPLYREKIRGFCRSLEQLPLSKSFPLNSANMGQYDIAVVGSDEVWNLFHPWYGKRLLFFGEGINAAKVISYAASFGNYPAGWGLEEAWAKRLTNFQSISVRDENSWWLVKNATGTEPSIALDPCLQFPVIAEDRVKPHLDRKYIAVYGHNFSEYFIKGVQQCAKARKLPLISIGYRNDWADEQWLTADPHEFAHFISNAEAVATNFFHGCIFSLSNDKPFVCESTPYRNNKLEGLLRLVGAEQHLMSDYTPVENFKAHLTQPINSDIHVRIEEFRNLSNKFLDKALAFQPQLNE